MIPWLHPGDPFPPLEAALAEPDGLLAASEDLTPARLLAAYTRGIFPWYSAGQPVLWWSPDPRMVLHTAEFKVSRSLRRAVQSARFEIRVDTAFDDVMRGCAAPRTDEGGTWITDAIRAGYGALHRQGYAHSVESWREGELVGGLYGVAIGRMFFGESMFARQTDASKVALAHLVRQLRAWEFPLIDCQQQTAHLGSLGARPISRDEFAKAIARLVHCRDPVSLPRRWTFDP
ncbi:MAG: leucyl/phenylalanyl-tRNA--protein transferase [Betaproteobacteria bacterium]|nr:leucyl/phenylalanyl-tRNA--protein transferase [Betaproteobacteria bacterium]